MKVSTRENSRKTVSNNIVLDTKDKFVNYPVNIVKDQYGKLLKDKDKAAEAMQSNVFQNFPKFISTSKEIGSILMFHIIHFCT